MQNSLPPVSLLLQNTYRPSQKTVRHAVRSVQRHSLKFATRRHFFGPALPLPAPRPGGRPHATPPVSVENTLDLKVVWEKPIRKPLRDLENASISEPHFEHVIEYEWSKPDPQIGVRTAQVTDLRDRPQRQT